MNNKQNAGLPSQSILQRSADRKGKLSTQSSFLIAGGRGLQSSDGLSVAAPCPLVFEQDAPLVSVEPSVGVEGRLLLTPAARAVQLNRNPECTIVSTQPAISAPLCNLVTAWDMRTENLHSYLFKS